MNPGLGPGTRGPAGNCVILYALIDRTVYLLSIKRHRQLSFDLAGHRVCPGADG